MRVLVDEGVHLVFFFLLLLLLALATVAAAVPGALGLGGGLANVVAVLEDLGVAWAGAGPEAGDAVVGARGEDVAERVPVERPDGVVVGVLDLVRGPDGLGGCGGRVRAVVGGDGELLARRRVGGVEEVVEEGAVHAAGGEQVGVDGVPLDGGNVLFVALEEADVAHHAEVEDAGGLVARRGGQAGAADPLERDLCDGALVPVEGGQASA